MRYISAAAAARIGGDVYDIVAVAGTIRLIVADVQGKGLAAVQTAAVVLASFRQSAYDAPDLAAIAEHIELSLEHQVPEERFVTAIMAEIVDDGTEIRLLNCGHPAPLLVSGSLARLAEPVEAALPLGLAGLTAGGRKEYTVPFGPDDRMLFYTDGISEARDTSGAFYPWTGAAPCSPIRTRTLRSAGSTTTSSSMSAAICTTTPPRYSSCARRHIERQHVLITQCDGDAARAEMTRSRAAVTRSSKVEPRRTPLGAKNLS